jgi:hypothetical protein
MTNKTIWQTLANNLVGKKENIHGEITEQKMHSKVNRNIILLASFACHGVVNKDPNFWLDGG